VLELIKVAGVKCQRRKHVCGYFVCRSLRVLSTVIFVFQFQVPLP